MIIELFGLGLMLASLSKKKEKETKTITQTTNKIKVWTGELDKKVERIAQEIGIPKIWLYGIMNFESGLNPYSKNNIGFGGLIGFGPVYGGGKYIDGTYSLDNLFKIGASGQLDYVRKYFLDAKKSYGNLKSKLDVYLAVFHPASIKYSNNDKHIVGSEISSSWAESVKRDNPVFNDPKAGGYVTIGKVREIVSKFF